MSKRKVSISIRDPAVYEYLRAQSERGSVSAFVCELVRRDMEHPKGADLDKKVEEIVRKLLQNADGMELHRPNQSKEVLSDEDKELLKSLF